MGGMSTVGLHKLALTFDRFLQALGAKVIFTRWCNGSTTGFEPVSPSSTLGWVAERESKLLPGIRCWYPFPVFETGGRTFDSCPGSLKKYGPFR